MFYNQKLYNIHYIQRMTQLYEIKVKLLSNQKKNLARAYHNRETIILRLAKDALTGNDTLYVPGTIVKRLEKHRRLKKGMDIKLAKTNIRKQVGGSLLTSILTLGRTFGPTVAKTLGLSALSGLASEGTSQLVKMITGKGTQTGVFLIPLNKIDQLIPYKHLLTMKQTQDLLKGIQTGSGVPIRLNKTQQGGFLGALLASIATPIALSAIKKLVSSGGARISKPPKASTKDGGSSPQVGVYRSEPFFGTWDQRGYGAKKKKSSRKEVSKKRRKGSIARKRQSIQWNPIVGSDVVKPKFYKNVPMSNHDLIHWCKYLNMPITDVLSRDETVPHGHKQALFIYNLEPSYMGGSHWVSTYVKDNVINYFDSFGMPPFQEMVNHAIRKNKTLLHQNNQIQNIISTTCGYFCLYFLNEMNKGISYYDLLKVFDIHDTKKNEKFIERYFKNI